MVTSGGKLHIKHIFHLVAMGYVHSEIESLLYSTTQKSLLESDKLGLESLVFPAFSCGRMKNPPDLVCTAMGNAILDYDFENSSLKKIGFAITKEEYLNVFNQFMPDILNRNQFLYPTSTLPEILDLPWKVK